MNINISIRECPKKKKILCYTVYNAGSEYKVRIQQMKILKILIFSKTWNFLLQTFYAGEILWKSLFPSHDIENCKPWHCPFNHWQSPLHQFGPFPCGQFAHVPASWPPQLTTKKKAMINLIAALANSFLVVVFKHWKPFFFMLGQGGLFWEEEFLISF